MYITITSIRLRKLWHYFPLTYNAMYIVQQMKGEKGFICMKNTGFGYMHYTLSAWESQEDLKRFAQSGAHLAAMKKSREISSELATYTYQSEEMPNWETAKVLLNEKGKLLKF